MRFLHTVHFKSASELAWAFEHLASNERVDDCLVEPDERRIRFVAPGETASCLIEKFYLRGGLTWSTRTPFPVAQTGAKAG